MRHSDHNVTTALCKNVPLCGESSINVLFFNTFYHYVARCNGFESLPHRHESTLKKPLSQDRGFFNV